MNILVVATKPLYPVRMGNQRWISEFILQLKSLGHTVIYLYIHHTLFRNYSKERELETLEEAKKQTVADKQYIFKEPFLTSVKISTFSLLNRALKKGFGGIDDLYPSGLTSFAKKIIKENKIEACVVNYYYLTKLLTKINVPIKALVTHDSFIYRNKRTGDHTHSLTPNNEAKALQRSTHVLSLQLEESALFKVLAPESYVATLFMPLQFHQNPLTYNHNILYFAGNSQYNINGVRWFIDKVLTELLSEFPDTKIIIGGGICKSLEDLKENKVIELKGFIEDIDEFFQLGDISINPVYQGSGLKIKTIESISYDKVTIVNPHSAAGLLKIEKNPFIEVSIPQKWIESISQLWKDKELLQNYKDRNHIYCKAINNHIKKELNSIFR